MRALWRAVRGIGRFVGSLRLGEDPAGDRVVAGGHARHMHSGLYSTPKPVRHEASNGPGATGT